MRIAAGVIVVAACLFASTSTAIAEPTGLPAEYSYEAGTLVPPWKEVFALPERITVVPSPTDPSHNVMRVEMRGGDLFAGPGEVEGRARAEVAGRYAPDTGNWPDVPPTSRWYGWKTFLEPGFPGALPWTIITQWKSPNCNGCNPLFSLVVDGENFEFHRQLANPKQLASWPGATRGTWHSFVVHVFWSPTFGGIVEVWHNGVQRYQNVGSTTAVFQEGGLNPAPVYVQHGIYRDASITGTAVLYHDTFRVGETQAAVQP
jgi:Polysaccharide lyase